MTPLRGRGRALGAGCLAALVLAGVGGCYRPWTPRGFLVQRAVDARELYREPDFARGSLARDGTAFLGARASFGQESVRRSFTQGLYDVIVKRLPDGNWMHPSETSNRINEAGLAGDYAAMLAAYDQTQILERETLRRLGEAVGVRYFALPIVVTFQETRDTRFSVLGVHLGRTASLNARVQLEFWDAQTGRIAWEGTCDHTLAEELVRERPIHFDDAVHATWESLYDRLPRDVAGGNGR